MDMVPPLLPLSSSTATTTAIATVTTTFSLLAGKPRFSLSLPNSSSSSSSSHHPSNLRRPKTLKPTSPKPSIPPPPAPLTPPTKTSSNPLKTLFATQNTPPKPQNLTPMLRLTSRISPLPPPPLPSPPPSDRIVSDLEDEVPGKVEFRQLGKIFVGNLPLWVKKPEVVELFRQFGPVKNVILIKGHDNLDRNLGFGFVVYDGVTAEKSAMKAVEFDGVEFHGRVLTVKLDDGRRLKMRAGERERWVQEGEGEGVEYRSEWHEEREDFRKGFKKVLESRPEDWQAVIRAFERINKPSRKEFGLLVKYYARRGDMHRARETFERMRARGIEPTSHVFTSLIHAYAVGRDMEEALSCVRKMKEEGIEVSLVTYSILVGGFARVGNVE